MLKHQTTYRVIYGDTDNMGVAYHANYLRWFEMGRTEMFRHLGMTYREIEAKGVYLPVSEDGKTLLASGYTKHACLNGNGRVVRPPEFLTRFIKANMDTQEDAE